MCKSLSRVLLFATPWAVALQGPLSMGFPRQEYWSGLLLPSPGDLPDPGIKLESLALQADSLPPEPPEKPCLVSAMILKSRVSFNKSTHSELKVSVSLNKWGRGGVR